MKKIIPITDLQRQAGQIIGEVAADDDSVIITQRGRPAAVIVSIAHYAQIEEDLERLDELELLEMTSRSRQAIAEGRTLSHRQVKAQIKKKQPARRAK